MQLWPCSIEIIITLSKRKNVTGTEFSYIKWRLPFFLILRPTAMMKVTLKKIPILPESKPNGNNISLICYSETFLCRIKLGQALWKRIFQSSLTLLAYLNSRHPVRKSKFGTCTVTGYGSFKLRRFWAMYVNGKWAFYIPEQRFCPHFQLNRLFKCKETKQYKFCSVKAY